MRAALGIVSLLLVLAVVGMLGKKQLASLRSPAPAILPAAPASTPATVRAQSEQMQQQVRQALDEAMQQPRHIPEDAK
ncbi:MAG: hypothetical protein HUU13_02255 [Burkholderiaceae bacterium]|nr:hypothetical protein [Burkholderiaceae bacterium]